LTQLIGRFRQAGEAMGLPLMPSETPIQPLLTGSAEQALQWSRQLEEKGILVTAIRPPTVPEGQARLRITFSANHTERQLDRLLDALQSLTLEQR
ncbi:MAG: aminotransferase class I/II-fold pyridoxal phosphate-dependent enzyme, partial [Candidatus Thiodiazotropha taylori]